MGTILCSSLTGTSYVLLYVLLYALLSLLLSLLLLPISYLFITVVWYARRIILGTVKYILLIPPRLLWYITTLPFEIMLSIVQLTFLAAKMAFIAFAIYILMSYVRGPQPAAPTASGLFWHLLGGLHSRAYTTVTSYGFQYTIGTAVAAFVAEYTRAHSSSYPRVRRVVWLLWVLARRWVASGAFYENGWNPVDELYAAVPRFGGWLMEGSATQAVVALLLNEVP